ncbi:hypothetical protein CAEBREN_02267 [Caenorhabditis brenneri]|uniref:Uncharacterized protein n=1 Tax=Caenorhabditis brenneri TaxID=135651 RepID=G0NNS2_CAEBE|nr:hypothetical protein CAEBREN_02267 [Caenorhabditis brenneri]
MISFFFQNRVIFEFFRAVRGIRKDEKRRMDQTKEEGMTLTRRWKLYRNTEIAHHLQRFEMLQAIHGDVNAPYKYDRERMMAMKGEMPPESASEDSQTKDLVKKTDKMAVKNEEKENVEKEKPAVQKPCKERLAELKAAKQQDNKEQKEDQKIDSKTKFKFVLTRKKYKKEEERVHVKRAKADVLKQNLLATSRTHSPTSDTTLCNYLQDLVSILNLDEFIEVMEDVVSVSNKSKQAS